MRTPTADERNRRINRHMAREARRREEREFAAIPLEIKNVLAAVFQDPRVSDSDRYQEATERLGRRPTVVEWRWAHKQEWQ